MVKRITFACSSSAFLLSAVLSNVLAQASNVTTTVATVSAGKGGTSGALPNAGSVGITYFLFVMGIILFVFGTLKLVFSYKK